MLEKVGHFGMVSDDKTSLPRSQDRTLEHLCRACGLCCDGSLFGRARLAPDEVTSARTHRLRVVANEGSFEQPCSALVDRTCTIYQARPRACRAFTCRLYERRDQPLTEKLAIVARTQALLAELQDAGASSNGRERDPRVAVLFALLEEHFERAR